MQGFLMGSVTINTCAINMLTQAYKSLEGLDFTKDLCMSDMQKGMVCHLAQWLISSVASTVVVPLQVGFIRVGGEPTLCIMKRIC